jgi:dienelactone hydrolase
VLQRLCINRPARHIYNPAMSRALYCLVTCICTVLLVSCPRSTVSAGTEQAHAALPARAAAPSGAENMSVQTADGFTVAGWYWKPQLAPQQQLAPGVLLLHMRGRDKGSWGTLPDTLRKEGFGVLAIDLRGHGETVDASGQRAPLDSLRDSDYQNMLFDVGAAHAWLRRQPGIDSERQGIIGASIGANLGILYAAQDRRIRTVVCLSPGLDYKGLQPLAALDAYDKRPLYLLVAKGDAESFAACEKLRDSAVEAKPASLRAFPGSDHGTELLRAHPGLDQTITTGWLLNYLPPER